jgi:uncharacterized protein YndB with AHSA1/START domain
MEFEETVTIQRPVQEVFAYMSNAEHDAEWRTNVKEIKRLSEGDESGVGTVYHQVVKGPFGRGLDADLRYTAYEPNRRLAFETISGGVRPSAVIEFSPVADNATEVRIRMTWEPQGGMRLAAPLVGGMLRRGLNASYANLVRHMEGSTQD